MFKYKYEDRHLELMKEQIWEARNDLDIYSKLSEFEFNQISGYINNPQTILELGCGLGRGSIYLHNLLQSDAKYYLADRTGMTINTGAFAPINDEYYNDLELTKDFCKLNGLTNCYTFDTELDDWNKLPKFDLIFSLCSFGMHVEIDRYLDRIISVAKEDCTLIFGCRSSYYTRDLYQDKFKKCEYINGTYSVIYPMENWLILKGLK